MRSQEARLRDLEQGLAHVRPSGDAGAAREKLAALVRDAGGQLPGESPAQATARVLGISTKQLLSELQVRANA